MKKLSPRCLDGVSSPFPWRTGLSSALRTTNPYWPAQNLYPKTRDRLMVQIIRAAEHRQLSRALQPADRGVLGADDISIESPATAQKHAAQLEGKPAQDGP